MKTRYIKLALVAALTPVVLTGCSDDVDYALEGDGTIALSASISNDVKVVSRATSDELRADYGESLELWITKPGSGPIRRYQGADNVPTEPVTLPAGSYVAEAWAGDSVSASFTDKYFKAYVPFTVTKSQQTPVDVQCKIANSVVSLTYDESVDEVLRPDFTMTVGHTKGTLTFEGRDSRKGYFMMPKADKTLTLTLTATTLDGKAYTQTATIEDAQPTTEYKVTVKYNHQDPDAIGGAYFDIIIDATEIVVEDNITLTLAPEIVGVGFDITNSINATPGTVGRRSVYIAAAEELTAVTLESTLLNALVGSDRIGLLNPAEEHLQTLAAAGINIKKYYLDETDPSRLTNLRINFEESYTNALPTGEHTFTIIAEDGDRKNQASLVFNISDAPIAINAVDDGSVTYTSAAVSATILKEGTSTVLPRGFYYRAEGATEWNFVEGTIAGTDMSATLTGLTNGTRYSVKAAYEGFETGEVTFTTLAYPQLPNAGFEDWHKSGSVMYPYAAGGEMFWDTGNGAAKMAGKTLTTYDTTIKHSGNRSAYLWSQAATVMGIGKFAAGNIFIGEFITTDGMAGILGWGRQFDTPAVPKALTGYVRYEPQPITDVQSNCPGGVKKGDMDQGIIYIVLLDGTGNHDNHGKYNTWPIVIRNNVDKNPQYFDYKTAPNVRAYGELVLTEATAGSGMIPFRIDLQDVNPNLPFVKIAITAASSRYGDYFTGGVNSKMWLDDLHLEY